MTSLDTNNLNIALNSASIIKTIKKLEKRIEDRFPESSLQTTCNSFLYVAEHSQENIDYIGRSHIPIRIFIGAIISMSLVGLLYSLTLIDFSFTHLSFELVVTLAEATINDLILLGAAIFFLATLEIRIKRAKALKILDQLRGLAHVIDMHQLTKDPTMLGLANFKTYNSPSRTLSKFELQRYLDYCSEMLSLIGKISALYAQSLSDDVIISAVNDIELLTSGLSRKIWQKLMILSSLNKPSSLNLD